MANREKILRDIVKMLLSFEAGQADEYPGYLGPCEITGPLFHRRVLEVHDAVGG
jgi:hypothetical protein